MAISISADERLPTRIRSVERAARLLTIVATAPESRRKVKDLSRQLGTSLGTTYHLLNTLVDAKLLTRDQGHQYHLGYGVGILASGYFRQTMPPSELTAPLKSVVEKTGESAYLSAWRHGELEVLCHLAGTRAVRVMDLKPGFHGVAHARASGKVLLAFAPAEERERYLATHPLEPITPHTITDISRLLTEIESVRARGYAIDDEEFSEGVGCIAVPIVDRSLLVGAYTVSAPIERSRQLMSEYLECLRRAADAVVQQSTPEFGDAASTPAPTASLRRTPKRQDADDGAATLSKRRMARR